MTIAEVSEKYGVTQDTIRYYERIGLVPRVNRKKSGIRDFTQEDCNWVEFIKCMRNAGLSIESLIEYVALYQQGEETLRARKQILIEERKELANRIVEMQSILARLDYKIEIYDKQCCLKK